MALAEFIGWHSVNWGMLVTGGFIASLPPIILRKGYTLSAHQVEV